MKSTNIHRKQFTVMKTQIENSNSTMLRVAIIALFLTGFFFQPVNSLAQNNPATPTENKKPGKTTIAHKTGYAAVNGLNLYYEIHGNGEPLVLLHGGLGAGSMFGNNVLELSRIRKVILVDLQGHGRTADIDRELSVELMADDIAALLKHLNIPKADIMGYSMGGGVALQIAIRHPGVVNKLVVASTPFKRDGFYPDILAQQAQIGPEAAEMMKQTPMYQLYDSIAPKKEDWKRLITKIGETMKKDYDWTASIKTIKAPTLVIAGDADIFPPSHAVELYGLLGGGQRDPGWDGSMRSPHQLAILPNATHYNLFSLPILSATAIAFLK
jgi:pimeloyl-ACP methyl ester carboxylesterase